MFHWPRHHADTIDQFLKRHGILGVRSFPDQRLYQLLCSGSGVASAASCHSVVPGRALPPAPLAAATAGLGSWRRGVPATSLLADEQQRALTENWLRFLLQTGTLTPERKIVGSGFPSTDAISRRRSYRRPIRRGQRFCHGCQAFLNLACCPVRLGEHAKKMRFS